MASLKNSFELLGDFLSERWRTPIGHVSFWTYLLIAIVGAGAVGVWVEIVRWMLSPKNEASGILTAIYTYFPAIAAGAALQLQMDAQDKPIRSFSIFCTALAGVLVLPHSLGLVESSGAFVIGLFGTGFAIWLWWIANGCNPSFLDSNPTDSLGDNPSAAPAGNTGGFTV